MSVDFLNAETQADSREAWGLIVVRFWTNDQDAYGLALLLVIASVLLAISSEQPVTGLASSIGGLLQAAALIAVLRVSGARPRSFAILSVTAAMLALIAVGSTWIGVAGSRTFMLTVLSLLAVAAQVAIIRRLRGYRQVDLRMVLGLLVVYVILGVEFAYAYLLVDGYAPGTFSAPLTLSSAEYLSFITLATVGHGDITPITGVARALAVAEAVVGQLYLVSVVSIAVGSFGRERVRRDDQTLDCADDPHTIE